jgi:hypothetical protein
VIIQIDVGFGPLVTVLCEPIDLHPKFNTVIHKSLFEGKPLNNVWSVTEWRTSKEIAWGSREEAIAKAKLYLIVLDTDYKRMKHFRELPTVNKPEDFRPA